MPERLTVPAGQGLAVALRAGQTLRVVNSHGTQCVDSWAIVPGEPPEYLSMDHCREVLQTIYYVPGQTLVTDRYRALLEIRADTSPGRHDTLIAACNRELYARAGRGPDHPNCADNLAAALAPFGVHLGFTPQPWNLFMRAPVSEDGRIDYVRPPFSPGAYVELRALAHCIAAFSACPDDVYPTNGGDGRPRDAHLEIGARH